MPVCLGERVLADRQQLSFAFATGLVSMGLWLSFVSGGTYEAISVASSLIPLRSFSSSPNNPFNTTTDPARDPSKAWLQAERTRSRGLAVAAVVAVMPRRYVSRMQVVLTSASLLV